MYLSKCGEIVQKWWDEIPVHFPSAETDAFVIMPNHTHGNIFIIEERRGENISPYDLPNNDNLNTNNENSNQRGKDASRPLLHRPTLGQVIAYFKYQSTKEMNKVETNKAITKFWQRNYYEHIIRNEKDLKQKTDYILNNPSRWDDDEENPLNRK